MRIWPILLDCVPDYLERAGGSLLLTPIGSELLVSRLCERVQAVTPNRPMILPAPRTGPAYRAALTAACTRATVLPEGDQLAEILPPLETSDVCLFIDARCFLADRAELSALLKRFSAGRQIAHHLVAFEASGSGLKEHVNTDRAGKVRSIHRYYQPATWPFLAGVAASLVPVSSSLLYLDLVPASLVALRQRLASRGAPGCDVAIGGLALDLTRRQGLLAAMEHCVVEEANHANTGGRNQPILVGEGHSIASTARILGPVVIHSHVRIGEHATIAGPALLGSGAEIAPRAVVAHAIVGPQTTLPAGHTLRDDVWFDDDDRHLHARPELSYRERLERFSSSPGATAAIEVIEAPSNGPYLACKRWFDVALAGVGLILLSPFLLLLAGVLRLESRGPIFYRGEREGLGGRLFNCLKFRTMQVGADEVQHLLKAKDRLDGPHFKLDDDPRVTRLGRILRATNIDELPQLINVVRGDMSLVGPRPSPFRENQFCVAWREGRLSVRPGVTGLWQVCRHDRSSGDFHQWIEYDLLYVQQASLVLDVKILLATIVTLAGRVPVPADWLVRLPRRVPPVGGTGMSEQPDRPISHGPAASPAPAPASSRKGSGSTASATAR